MVFRINFGKNIEKISLKAVLLAKSQAVCSNVNKNAPSKSFDEKFPESILAKVNVIGKLLERELHYGPSSEKVVISS